MHVSRNLISLALAAIVCGGFDGIPQPKRPVRGFTSGQGSRLKEWEEKLKGVPDPQLLREYMAHLSAEPHHLGSAKGKANAEWMRDLFRRWGFEASIEEFEVLFPTPKERRLELLAPDKHIAGLQEPALAEDPDSSDVGQLPTYNAYSADGDVTAQLVYVNYGVPDDYETLRKLGVDVQGKIVLARYGGSWRGIKPKVAFENGAVGCLIYSDPKDDGYYRGNVYPEGAYRPQFGVQRGSVMDMPIHPGDPLTPGVGATVGAQRLPLDRAQTLTRIPVLPISWGDALPLLASLRGPIAPEPWRGALPTTYNLGPGPALVRLKIVSDWNRHSAYDVVARIPGKTFPDEWIIRGNHHDAWVNGAADPISGMVALLEEARAFGELLKEGWRPERTIVFTAWDGEEQGLLGSTEWAEAHAADLREKAVAYINSDTNGKGWLEAGGSHSLERFVREAAESVTDPVSGRSVYDALWQRQVEQARGEPEKRELRQRRDLRLGALGSGSDYTVFLDYMGIASLNLGFGGGGDGGVYHSIYDSFAWYTRFADTTFVYGRALSQLNGIAVLRLASAPILPFEFGNLAETVEKYVAELSELAGKEGGVDIRPLKSALDRLTASAAAYEKALASAPDEVFHRPADRLAALNRILYQTERSLASPEGLPKRPWFKHQLYAPGFYTGYGVKTVPYVREALEQKDWDEAKRGVETVRGCLLALAGQIDAATALLK